MKTLGNSYWEFSSVFLVALMISSLAIANESDTALQLINGVEQASKSLNYKGVFVYLRDSQLEAVRIIHKADELGEYDRLISLNGMPQEIIRNNGLVTCVFPDNKTGSARGENFHDKNYFPKRWSTKLKVIGDHYQFSIGGMDRVAGRSAQRVIITPIDQYRYGYRLWVDSETGLLLKTTMIGKEGGTLEQIMFTSVLLREKIEDTDLLPTVAGKKTSCRQSKPLKVEASDYESKWEVDWVPEGFTLVAHGKHLLPNSQAPVEHFAYSDGLGSVSVFIEPIMEDHQSYLRGFSSMGAVNAYGIIQALHNLTIVGEVPHTTVERIGKSIHYINSSAD
ncbi:MucB/RseB C-terminal domain-containing protein [Candidatus Nitrosoglobus terrae]|nr:MucB/RseB C-terminal domain-containing protein [Candidatus Nitrosoglobus terrae]